MNNFEERLQAELDKLPKHEDNPSYSEGLGDGFEAGARWAAKQAFEAGRQLGRCQVKGWPTYGLRFDEWMGNKKDGQS